MFIYELQYFSYKLGLPQGKTFFHNIYNSDFTIFRMKSSMRLTPRRGTPTLESITTSLNL